MTALSSERTRIHVCGARVLRLVLLACAVFSAHEGYAQTEQKPFSGWWLSNATIDEAMGSILELPQAGYFWHKGELRFSDPSQEVFLEWRGVYREPQIWRALIEEVIILGVGNAWYFANLQVNQEDWDNPDWRARFVTGEAIRFDNNSFLFNNWYHPFDGGIFYAFARANDFGPAASFGFALAASTLWEFLSEFREKVSINDMIMTPGGGVPLGEFWHVLGDYLCSAPPRANYGRQIAAFFLGSHECLHTWMDRDLYTNLPQYTDHLGLNADIWHRFELGASMGTTLQRTDPSLPQNEVLYGFDLSGRFVAMPGYLRPGEFDHVLTDAAFSSMRLSGVFSNEGLREIMVSSDVGLVHYYQQALEGTTMETRSGYAFRIGLDSGIDISEFYDDALRDRRALFHTLGLRPEVWWIEEPFELRVSGLVSYDFAAIDALPWGRWRNTYPDTVTKSVLEKQGYYYAGGINLEAELSLRLDTVSLEASMSWGSYASIDGVDRFQEAIEDDVSGRSVLLRWSAALHYALFAPWQLQLFLGCSGFDHLSRLGQFTTDVRYIEMRSGARVVF